MSVSILDIFSIGIGPSSSHTLGPMRAANDFVEKLLVAKLLPQVTRIQIDLYGSLALTGKGHKTDAAIVLGLHGFAAETIEIENVAKILKQVAEQEALLLNNTHSINFVTTEHLVFHKEQFLAKHANGMMLSAYADDDKLLQQQTYFSIGGGFIITDEENIAADDVSAKVQLPYEFRSAKQLLHLCRVNQLTIAELMLANEEVWRNAEQSKAAILNIAQVMQASIDRGCQQVGVLPGGLNVRRRAPALFTKLTQKV